MGARKTSVAIDEELLAAAKTALNTNTVRATIEQALLEVLRTRARREEVQALRSMNGIDLADPVVMANAWRN